MSNMNNIAGISVATSANNNNQNSINNYEFYRISGGHNFADLAGAVEEMKDVNDAIGVRGYEGIRIFVLRDEGMWTLTMFNLVGIGEASHEEKYNLGQRMTANMVKRIEDLVLAFIDTIADYEQVQSDEQDAFQQFCNTFTTYDDVQGAFNTVTERIADDYGSYLNDLYGDDFRAFLDGEQAWGQCGDCGDEQFEDFAIQQGISLSDGYGRVYGRAIMNFVVRHYLMEMYDNETLVDYLMDTYDYLCPTLWDIVGLIPNTDGCLIWAADAGTISDVEHTKYAVCYGA